MFIQKQPCGRTRDETLEMLEKQGFKNITVDQVYSSDYVTARYLTEKHPEITKVRLIGTQASEDELFLVGVKADGGEQPDEQKFISYDDLLYNTDLDPEIKAVVVSHDPRYNHTKMCMASITLQ